MNSRNFDRTHKRAPMHSADADVELFTGRVRGGCGIDDLEEEEINRLLKVLESGLAPGGANAS